MKLELLHSGQKCFIRVAYLWSKMSMLQRAGMREGGEPLPVAFQHLILMIWRPCELNLAMIFWLASKCKYFKLRGLQFCYIKWLKKGISTLKSWHFEASEDIITKFKSQGPYIIRIKYWNANGSGIPPSLIPPLQNIGILPHKQAIG